MSNEQQARYNVVSARRAPNSTKDHYTRLGAAFPHRGKPGFTVMLNATPAPDAEMNAYRLLIFPADQTDGAPPADMGNQSATSQGRYNACMVRQVGDKNFYDRIGVAFPHKNRDGFTLILNALPFPDIENKCYRVLLFPADQQQDEQSSTTPGHENTGRERQKTDIPF